MKIFLAATALSVGFAGAASATPVTLLDFGSISGGSETATGNLANVTDVNWYSFEAAAGATYVDIFTSNRDFDTELGLWAVDGMFIASDDDGGDGLGSALSFGTGSGTSLGGGSAMTGAGQDGSALAAGTYYLSVSTFNTTFFDNYITTFSPSGFSGTGNYDVTVLTDVAAVPLPAGLPLMALAFAGLGAVGYRRKAA